MSSLGDYRKKIDCIDRKIAGLLKSRFETVKKISKFKNAHKLKVTDKQRELKVIKNIRKYSKSHRKFLIGIYKDIINYSKKLQKYG